MLSSPSTTRPRPPSQTRRTMPAPPTPTRVRTQSHTPTRARTRPLDPPPETDAPPPYSQDTPSDPTLAPTRPNPRHSLTEIDDMLNVAGSVVRNRERELDAAALASRSLLEENKLMFAKREALLARLPISPRSSLSSSSERQTHQPTNRSSSWSTCSSDSDMDNSASATPRRDALTPLPVDPLEVHRIHTPTHSAAGSVDLSSMVPSPPMPPAARLVPTQAERIAALHAGLGSPPPTGALSRANSSSRRVSVSPAAVTHLQDANSALLARVEELEEATAKAQTDGAARMRRLQAEAESLRARLGEAERANEGLRTEAEREKERLRVRALSVGANGARHQKKQSADADEPPVPPVPRDFAPGATWKPEFRSLRGGVRPIVPDQSAQDAPKTPIKRSLTSSTAASRAQATGRAQSNATPPRVTPGSPLKHTPIKPSLLRHQRANSMHAGKPSFKSVLSPVVSPSASAIVGAVLEEMSEGEGNRSPGGLKPSPTRISVGVLPFPTSAVEDEELDISPLSTRLLAQELVAKINELRSTNEEILQQRDALKEMLEVAESEADELKRVCERLENEVERTSEGTASGGEGRMSGGEMQRPSSRAGGRPLSRAGERPLSRAGDRPLSRAGGRGSGSEKEGTNIKKLELRSLGLGDLGEEPPSGWTGSVRGRKKVGGALESLAAELGAELQAPTDDDATDLEIPAGQVDLASELMSAAVSQLPTPADRTFGFPHGPITPMRSSSRNGQVGPGLLVANATPGPSKGSTNTPDSVRSFATSGSTKSVTPGSTKRALGNRGLATRPKTNTRRVRKSLSSVMFNSGGKALPSPLSSPTTAKAPVMSPVGEASDSGLPITPEKNKEEVGQRSEFLTPEVYLTPASSLRIPGGISFPGMFTDDEDASPISPVVGRGRVDSTMAQLRAGLDPLFSGVVLGQAGPSGDKTPTGGLVRRKPSNSRLLFEDKHNMEPWETKLRDLYTQIAMEQEDGGMSSAGEEGWRGSRRARALGRLSLRRKVDDGISDYAADDSETCDVVQRRKDKAKEEAEAKRVAGFELARKLHQKSMSTFLEVLLLIQFAVVLIVFVYTAVRRGPKAVLGQQRRS